MPKTIVNFALIGAGTVGSGVIRIFQENLALLEAKAGTGLRLTWVASRSKKALPEIGGLRPRFTKNWRDIVKDPAVDVVVELVGGLEPARTIVLEALKAGKQVTTANKAILAHYWDEIFTLAQARKCLVYFEAAVGGGIPVIQGINEGLAGNKIQRLYGIMNGTTNYILTRMSEEGMNFATALAAAQKAGFAEKNPSFDIDGIDASHKLAVLASLSTGGWVRVEDVERESLAGFDAWDLNFARSRLGLAAKFLSLLDIDGDAFSARVHPTLIPQSHPFANVRNEYNAFFVHGDAVGDVMFYGRGAGAMATASAVVSDVVYQARQVATGIAGHMPYVVYNPALRLTARPGSERRLRHYLRFRTADRPGVLAKITAILGKHRISIASLHQDEGGLAPRRRGQKAVPIVIVTHDAPDGAVRAALQEAGRFSALAAPAVHLRIDPLR